ncbi:Helix-turn-helix domain protein [compost metagenome]
MPDYLSPASLAMRLDVTRQAVYQWVENGTIPPDYVVRIGRTVRIRADFIERMKEVQTQEAPDGGPAA